jgi:hypothetical protein
MRAVKSVSVVSLLAAAGIVAGSCGKSEDSKTEGVTATNVADLKLSSAFNIELPTAIAKAAGQSSYANRSARLVGKKSSEACRTVQNVAMMFETLGSIGGMMCHLEAESANISFGKKYKIVMQMGAESQEMPLWIDNSVGGQLTMYTCEADKIREKILLTGSSSSGAKGTIHFKGSDGSNAYANLLNFDLTSAGLKILNGQNVFSDGSSSYSQDNALEFRDSGVSLMKSASKGTMAGGMSFQDRGAVKHNGTMGQALFKGEGNQPPYGTYSYSTRSTFDGEGVTVANGTASSDITVNASELPSFLADDFSISDATGWDCSTEETLTIDMATGATAAAHAACERDHSGSFECWGSDFEQGENETIE